VPFDQIVDASMHGQQNGYNTPKLKIAVTR